jgi:molybdate transport system substrate-binding protein
LPRFEQSTGVEVVTASGASQGNGPETIGAQLARGTALDVVILSRDGLTELIKAKRIAKGSDIDLAHTPLGIAVRAGAAKPDASSVEAFKQLMLRANIVAMPASTAGIWLTTNIFPKLGIADKVNVKMTPRGSGATAMVAAGEADIAVMPISEIVHAAGVDLAAKVPNEIQLDQVFSAAVVSGSNETASARRLIEFLASPAAAETIRMSGMEPMPATK